MVISMPSPRVPPAVSSVSELLGFLSAVQKKKTNCSSSIQGNRKQEATARVVGATGPV